MKYVMQNCMTEWGYRSGRPYADPDEVELDVIFTDPDGEERRVPTFWAGELEWRVRYSSPRVGRHTFRTVCSDSSNADLHGQVGTLEVGPYQGDNPLFRHGPLRVVATRRHLEHLDGTPFFWLADTWWMGLCKRLRWPADVRLLTADRVAKGFSVIQIVAGLYPDMPPFDERGANETGFPWKQDFSAVNPAYFDMADLRINFLVDSGLVPCLVGCWGYFLPLMGVEKMKRHWRNLIARYGAFPVVWCLAGEGIMPYYRSSQREQDSQLQKQGWTKVAAYVRQVDPYHHPVTIHPTDSARNQVEDPGLLDLDMLQTGHGSHTSIPNTVNQVVRSYGQSPPMPGINGEVCYEGIMEASRQEVQRFMFWACILSGAAGHTYGANGIWQVNTRKQPFGASPHGRSWGDTPWEEAYQLPGSAHLGVGKRLLERYSWWEFEPHPEWVDPHWSEQNYVQPYAAGIPGKVRVVYLPTFDRITIRGLESGTSYYAFYFDPKSGKEHAVDAVQPDANGGWQAPAPPIFQDWVLVLDHGQTGRST